jgi:hypothetical protein
MMCRPKYVEQLRNIGIISSTSRLHLVGSLYEIVVKYYIHIRNIVARKICNIRSVYIHTHLIKCILISELRKIQLQPDVFEGNCYLRQGMSIALPLTQLFPYAAH